MTNEKSRFEDARQYRPPDGFEAALPGTFSASTVYFRTVADSWAVNRLRRDAYGTGQEFADVDLRAWGIESFIDNPFAIGPAGVDVDISVQALTKYPSGGGDVLMRSITTQSLELTDIVRAANIRHGWGISPECCAKILRKPSSCSTPDRYGPTAHPVGYSGSGRTRNSLTAIAWRSSGDTAFRSETVPMSRGYPPLGNPRAGFRLQNSRSTQP